MNLANYLLNRVNEIYHPHSLQHATQRWQKRCYLSDFQKEKFRLQTLSLRWKFWHFPCQILIEIIHSVFNIKSKFINYAWCSGLLDQQYGLRTEYEPKPTFQLSYLISATVCDDRNFQSKMQTSLCWRPLAEKKGSFITAAAWSFSMISGVIFLDKSFEQFVH